ncbi:MAG: hypothetical protein ACPG06_01205 [Alphaproteobacteria bacterium]
MSNLVDREVLAQATRMGYRSSDHMHDLGDGFIERMQGGATKPEPKVVAELITGLMNETLDAYITRPATELSLRPHILRSAMFAVNAVKKTGNVVIGRVTKKMSIEQNRGAADYMDSLRVLFNEDDELVTYVGFPIDAELKGLAQTALPLAMEQELSAHNRELADFLAVMFDNAAFYYLDQPIGLMKFGPLMGKIVHVGADAIKGALRSAIRDIVPKLNAEEAAGFAHYLAEMLFEWPDDNAAS